MDKIDQVLERVVNTVEMWTRSAMKGNSTQNELYDIEQKIKQTARIQLLDAVCEEIGKCKYMEDDGYPHGVDYWREAHKREAYELCKSDITSKLRGGMK